MKHVGISWEWALSFSAVIIFVLGMEVWKLTKRSLGWFAAEENEDDVEAGKKGPLSLRQGFFSFSRATSLVKETPHPKSVVQAV